MVEITSIEDLRRLVSSEEPIGSCYWERCVWKARVMHGIYAAAKIWKGLRLSVEALRSAGATIPRGEGRKTSIAVWKALKTYLISRRAGEPHAEALHKAIEILPLMPSNTTSYISDSFLEIYSKWKEILQSHHNLLPPTGWGVVMGSEGVVEITPPLLRRKLREWVRPILVICGDKICYPSPARLRRTKWIEWLSKTNQPLYTELKIELEALTPIDYIERHAEELAARVRKNTITIYMKAPDPRKHAKNTALIRILQDVVMETEKIESEKIYREGLETLGIREEDIEAIISKYLQTTNKHYTYYY